MDDERLECEFLNLLKWTEVVALMLGLLDDKKRALRSAQLALNIDLVLGAKIASSVRDQYKHDAINLISKLEIPEKLKLRLLSSTNSESGANHLRSRLSSLSIGIRKEASIGLLKMVNSHALNICFFELENAQEEICLQMRDNRSFSLYSGGSFFEDLLPHCSQRVAKCQIVEIWSKCLEISLWKGHSKTAIIAAKEITLIDHRQLILKLKNIYHRGDDLILKLRVIDIAQNIGDDEEILKTISHASKIVTYFLLEVICCSEIPLLRKFAGISLNELREIDEHILKIKLKRLLKNNDLSSMRSAVHIMQIVYFSQRLDFLKLALENNKSVRLCLLEILGLNGRSLIDIQAELLDYDDTIFLNL
jgi:hypothetical protein